jgi:hypothetical protein
MSILSNFAAAAIANNEEADSGIWSSTFIGQPPTGLASCVSQSFACRHCRISIFLNIRFSLVGDQNRFFPLVELQPITQASTHITSSFGFDSDATGELSQNRIGRLLPANAIWYWARRLLLDL